MPKLNPTVPPFTTFTMNTTSPSMSTHSSTNSRTDRSSNASQSSTSTTNGRIAFPTQVAHIRAYGESWIRPTSANPPGFAPTPQSLNIMPHATPKRTRSPSTPIPASHTDRQYWDSLENQVRSPCHYRTQSAVEGLRELGVSLHPIGTTYRPYSFVHHQTSSPLITQANDKRSTSYSSSFNPFDADIPTQGRPIISKHTSIGRLGHHANQLDTLDENDYEDNLPDKHVSHTGHKLNSKSMPAMSIFGQKRNGAPIPMLCR